MGNIRQIKPRTFGIGKCETCGKEFIKTAGNQRFCSLACRDVTYESYWESINAVVSDCDVPGSRRCKVCGKLFELKCRGSKALYCSDECRKIAAKQRYDEQKKHRCYRTIEKQKKEPKTPQSQPQPKDGFTWEEIRAVLGEYKISSYQKAVEILKKRKREKERGREE